MDPATMAAIATILPQVLKGAGQIAGGLSNAQGYAFGQTSAQDPMKMQQGMVAGMQEVVDPNSQLGRNIEAQQMRTDARGFNMANKGANEGLKRQYAADSYSAAQRMGQSGIDAYLRGAQSNRDAMMQGINGRW